jgi:hypothetical protein
MQGNERRASWSEVQNADEEFEDSARDKYAQTHAKADDRRAWWWMGTTQGSPGLLDVVQERVTWEADTGGGQGEITWFCREGVFIVKEVLHPSHNIIYVCWSRQLNALPVLIYPSIVQSFAEQATWLATFSEGQGQTDNNLRCTGGHCRTRMLRAALRYNSIKHVKVLKKVKD